MCVNGVLIKFVREQYSTDDKAVIDALKKAKDVVIVEGDEKDEKPSIDDLRAEYEKLYGEKPHGNFGEAKLSELIAEKLNSPN